MPGKFPPPLPPRPLPREPFLKVKSDPPPVATEPRTVFESQTISLDDIAIEVDRAVDTPRSFGNDSDPRDLLIDSMKQELAALRALHSRPPSEPPFAPSRPESIEPAPETRPSERVRRSKARVALLWSVAGVVLPAAGAAVARRWPELAEPIEYLIKFAAKAKELL